MCRRVIFSKNKFAGALYSVMFLALASLTFLNNQFSFDLKSDVKVRDAAGFAKSFDELEKLSLHSSALSQNIATTAVPKTTSYSYYTPVIASSTASQSTGADFNLPTPIATSDSSYISPSESRILVYKDKFLFGHSSSSMNWVKSAGANNTISVNINGSQNTYHIVQKLTLPLETVEKYYYSITEFNSYRGKKYDLITMTCGDGTYGVNGNNNQYRTFIFANF